MRGDRWRHEGPAEPAPAGAASGGGELRQSERRPVLTAKPVDAEPREELRSGDHTPSVAEDRRPDPDGGLSQMGFDPASHAEGDLWR